MKSGKKDTNEEAIEVDAYTQTKRLKALKHLTPIFLDRIDPQIEITPVPFSDISNSAQGESSQTIRERVIKARHLQEERFKESKLIHCNAQMTERMIHQYAEPYR